MNPKTSNNIFFVALVCILLQTFIVSHTNAGKLIKRQANYPQNVDFSTMKFTKNPPTNGRRFDAAKEAMNLVTTIDLPTCRCVNTLLSESKQCEVPIPEINLRILNIDCRKVLGCKTNVSRANFGVCCRRRKYIKPYVTPGDLRQLINTLGRLDKNGVNHQQCNIARLPTLVQVPQTNSRIYVTPVHTTPKAVPTKHIVPNVQEEDKIMTDLLIEKNKQDIASIRLASDTSEQRKTLDSNKFQVEETTSATKKKLIETKVSKNEKCRCVTNGNCSNGKIDFSFGESCKIGTVRCCTSSATSKDAKNIIPSATKAYSTTVSTPFTSDDVDQKMVSSPSTIRYDIPTPKVETNKTSLGNIEEPNNETTITKDRIANHKASIKPSAPSSIKDKDLSIYHRHSVPSKSSYVHRITSSRPQQFYEQLNLNARKIFHAPRPRYHPNDGRFYNFPINHPNTHPANLDVKRQFNQKSDYTTIPQTNIGTSILPIQERNRNSETSMVFPPKEQRAQNRNLELPEGEDLVDDSSEIQPSLKKEIANVEFLPNNNPNIVSYPYHRTIIKPIAEPSLLQSFGNFFTGIGKSVTQVLG